VAVTHLRMHLFNDLTWCRRQISTSPNLKVVTVSLRLVELSGVRYGPDGKIDYTPLTDAEREELRQEMNATYSQVTCKRCTRGGKAFQVR
jgi:hypothetical protein